MFSLVQLINFLTRKIEKFWQIEKFESHRTTAGPVLSEFPISGIDQLRLKTHLINIDTLRTPGASERVVIVL